MSDLTEEQYTQVPEFLQGDYEKDGDSYVHIGIKKIKQAANNLDEKNKGAAKELADFKVQEQINLDAARQEAYNKAIKEGDVESLTTRHNEQIETTKTSSFEAGKVEALAEFKTSTDTAKGDNLSLKLASELGADEFAIDMLEREIRSRIQVDGETSIFLDADGSATVLTQTEFKEVILNEPRYSRLLKNDITTTGGGNVNGSGRGSTAAADTLEACKGDKALEAAYFNKQLAG